LLRRKSAADKKVGRLSYLSDMCPYSSLSFTVKDTQDMLDDGKVEGCRHTIQFRDQSGNVRTLIETPTPTKPCSQMGKSQVGEYNQVLRELLEMQSGGDLEARLEQAVQYRPLKAAAIEHLAIHLRFDPRAALDVRTKGNFTNKQLALLRTLGVHLPGFYEIREQEDKLLFPFELFSAELEVGTVKAGEKWPGNTTHEIREVRTSTCSQLAGICMCTWNKKKLKCLFFFLLFLFLFFPSRARYMKRESVSGPLL